MSSAAETLPSPFSPLEQLREGRRILRQEAAGVVSLADSLDAEFCTAADWLHRCAGRVIVTGIGKAGLIGRKLVATLSSTGTRAHFLHPAEAIHGDLGCLHPDDVVLALSNSGESEEVCRLLPVLRELRVPLIAVTSRRESTLGTNANLVLGYGPCREADPLGLAPSVSTTVMLALGDALALVVARMRGFTPAQFARFHPGGNLGRQLRTVRETMRGLDRLRVARESDTIRDVFRNVNAGGRRTGAVILVADDGTLAGLFTDSDLARLFSRYEQPPLDAPIADVMTRSPTTIPPEALLVEAVDLLSRRKLSELPVIDASGRPIGLIDITDVIALMPQELDE